MCPLGRLGALEHTTSGWKADGGPLKNGPDFLVSCAPLRRGDQGLDSSGDSCFMGTPPRRALSDAPEFRRELRGAVPCNEIDAHGLPGPSVRKD
jgi:hypothetical protein